MSLDNNKIWNFLNCKFNPKNAKVGIFFTVNSMKKKCKIELEKSPKFWNHQTEKRITGAVIRFLFEVPHKFLHSISIPPNTLWMNIVQGFYFLLGQEIVLHWVPIRQSMVVLWYLSHRLFTNVNNTIDNGCDNYHNSYLCKWNLRFTSTWHVYLFGCQQC